MTSALLASHVSSTDFFQNLVAGIALGCKYALIALGFVVVFRATGVINFANSAFVIIGAYLAFNFSETWGFNFYLAILASMASGFVLGILLEAVVLRKLVGEAPFTVIMVTIGLLFVLQNLVMAIWGTSNLDLNDPWTGNISEYFGVRVTHRDLWAMGFTAAVLSGFLLFFRYSKMGLAMRATALDPEAARAQGIGARSVYRVTWGIAGLVAALAGVTFSTGSTNVEIGVGVVAIAAFPAMILGGMDSPLGAVVGGITIGIVQQMTQLYADDLPEAVGTSPGVVAPYVVMVVILMVRPYGLFGTPEVRRA